MLTFDSDIRDQAYQFFIQESLEFLQVLEAGLLTLRQDHSVPKVHELMRAAHSIKGGAASVGLPLIQELAHQLEEGLRSLYRDEVEVDLELEELLLRAYDCVRSPLVSQIETGTHDLETAVQVADSVFAQLRSRLGDAMGGDHELPTAAELGVDIVQVIFSGDVSQGIDRLDRVLSSPTEDPVYGEICAQAEVFVGVGELVNLPGFVAIAKATIAALEAQPHQAEAIGKLALADFRAAQQTVLAGDRVQGGVVSAALLRVAQAQTVAPAHIEATLTPIEATLTPESQPSAWVAESLLEEFINPFSLAFSGSISDSASEDVPAPAPVPAPVFEDAANAIDCGTHSVNQPVHEQTIICSDEPVTESMNQPVDGAIADSFAALEEMFAYPTSIIEPEVSFSLLNADPSTGASGFDETLRPTQSGNAIAKHRAQAQPADPVLRYLDQYVKQPSPSPAPLQSLQQSTAPYISNTIRVDLQRLERLNNLVGELVTQENATTLQSQQLQDILKRTIQRLKRFDQVTRTLQTWSDRHQNTNTTPPSLPHLSTQLETHPLNSPSPFDPLQLDTYSPFYNAVQDIVEEIAHLEEMMRDMALLTQQSQQTQRKKQQTLKQVRNDLLWARMLPVGDLLQRFPRMVRDLSAKHQKRVLLNLSGTTTLIDKAILEKLFDPLVHLVRNAFDHGIEPAEVRVAQGKPTQGSIDIRAYHRGNQTYIEVQDDGKGLDLDAIRKKAIALNLIPAAVAHKLAHDPNPEQRQRLYELIFAPGFSTADRVSQLSGRGMGMDAVRSQIKKLKGDITVHSEIGKGTTFILRLPLTLTIAKLMVFSLNTRLMALPIASLAAILTVPSDQIRTVRGNQFYRWQNQLVPLCSPATFAKHYPLSRTSIEQMTAIPLPQKGKIPLLIIGQGREAIALQIDQVLQEQELVIKPFGVAIAPPPYLLGCTILGDGAIVPVLDGQALVEHQKHHDVEKSDNLQHHNPPAESLSDASILEREPEQDDELFRELELLLQEEAIETSEVTQSTLSNSSATPAVSPLISPRVSPPKSALSSIPYSSTPYPLPPAILVIDDSLTTRQSLVMTLNKAGYRTLQAREGKEAIAHLQTGEIQAVFCDIEMPVMNGFEFLNHCRQHYSKETLPVIMLTSRSSQKHRQIAEYMGATGYLTKPYLEQDLLQKLRNCLQ